MLKNENYRLLFFFLLKTTVLLCLKKRKIMIKTLLTVAALTVVTFCSVAQKDISVTLNTPTAGTSIEPGVAFDAEFTVTNEGPDDLILTDSVYFDITVAGTTVFGGSIFLASRTNAVVAQGGSWVNTVPGLLFNTIPAAIGGAQDLCVVVYLYEGSNATPTVEANTANNTSCLSYNFVVGAVGLEDGLTLKTTTANVFPNPASDVINFELNGTDAKRIEILNLTGQVVLSTSVSNGAASANVNELKEGVYLFTVYSNEGAILTDKFIVK